MCKSKHFLVRLIERKIFFILFPTHSFTNSCLQYGICFTTPLTSSKIPLQILQSNRPLDCFVTFITLTFFAPGTLILLKSGSEDTSKTLTVFFSLSEKKMKFILIICTMH
jgi:hypothetical protein